MEQIQELLANCTSVWTSFNGVYVREFTGPNGGKVFLPAAGHHWLGGLAYEGSRGYCWSSVWGPDYGDGGFYACYLGFNSGNAFWSDYGFWPYIGMSVRPVSR